MDPIDMLQRLAGKRIAWYVGHIAATLWITGLVVSAIRAAIPQAKRAAWARLWPRWAAFIDLLVAIGAAIPQAVGAIVRMVTGRALRAPTPVAHETEPGRSER